MNNTELIDKLINGKRLSEKEVQNLVTGDYDIPELNMVDENEGDTDRWSQFMETVFSFKGRYYALDWQRGLTEMQENYYDSQVAAEVKEVKKTIVVTEWEGVKK